MDWTVDGPCMNWAFFEMSCNVTIRWFSTWPRFAGMGGSPEYNR